MRTEKKKTEIYFINNLIRFSYSENTWFWQPYRPYKNLNDVQCEPMCCQNIWYKDTGTCDEWLSWNHNKSFQLNNKYNTSKIGRYIYQIRFHITNGHQMVIQKFLTTSSSSIGTLYTGYNKSRGIKLTHTMTLLKNKEKDSKYIFLNVLAGAYITYFFLDNISSDIEA